MCVCVCVCVCYTQPELPGTHFLCRSARATKAGAPTNKIKQQLVPGELFSIILIRPFSSCHLRGIYGELTLTWELF